MALFKISKGSKSNLPSNLTEGFCWYTYDDSKFYIDHKDANGTLVRKALNAQDADTLMGMSLDEIKEDIAPKTSTITLLSSAWTNDVEPYSQVVSLSNITANSKVDLQPTVAQLLDLLTYGVVLQAVNEDGVVTVYATGGKPVSNYDIQVSITETEAI